MQCTTISNANAVSGIYFLERAPPAVMLSCSDIFSCKYPTSLSFKLSVNNDKFYSFCDMRIEAMCFRCAPMLLSSPRLSCLLVRETDATWSLVGSFPEIKIPFNGYMKEAKGAVFIFAQWRYRNQWGSTEVRLLLVENFYQYPAMTMWNTIGYGNFWKFLRKLIIYFKHKIVLWTNTDEGKIEYF